MYYRSASLKEDIALKKIVLDRHLDKPNFDWDQTLAQCEIPEVTVTSGDSEKVFSLAEVATMIGSALTDLALSLGNQEKEQIFSRENCQFVSEASKCVADRLLKKVQESGSLRLSRHDLYFLIEKALIDCNRQDVARSLIFQHSMEGDDALSFEGSSVVVSARLIRRNGKVVPWNQAKIEIAVRRAFLSIGEDSEPAVKVAHAVSESIRQGAQALVHIEDIQDIVQEELMRQSYFKVAEAYILYREEHSKLRVDKQSEIAESDSRQEAMVLVHTKDGENQFWDGSELKARITFASIGLNLTLNEVEIETELLRSVGAEIKQTDLKKTVILNAKSLMERDGDFAKFAGRILLSYIYEEVLDWKITEAGHQGIKEAHQKAFETYINQAIKIGRLRPELRDYDLKQLADVLDPTADLDFEYLGVQTLYDRYLIIDRTGEVAKRMEVPQFFWLRVAMGLFVEESTQREQKSIELYQLYKGRRFCSSTPTLFNSGTLHSQLSSCYLYKVDDSIESIMIRGIAENAFLSKWAGGLGGSWTAVRGTGSYIKGTNGDSQGVIPFLKLHNDQLVAVNQGGKRRGSGCAYLETWHSDIEDFLELRRNTGDDRRRCHDMNTANWIPDLFMKRMEARTDWTLFRSNQVPDLHDLYGKAFELRYEAYEAMAAKGEIWSKTIPAIKLWKKMLSMIFETGHPWITFKDPCNLRSTQDHVGVIHSSNLCTEIVLNTGEDETAVCNLGSVVLDNHLTEAGSLDHDKLRETIRIAIRALDNVIDVNFYPTEAAKTSNLRHRPIGLGVMGLQNALAKRGVSFASEEAIAFNDEFMEAIAYYAYEASSDIAKEKGAYSSYSGSKWDRGLLPHDTLDLLQEERGGEINVPRGGQMDWQPLRDKIASQGMRNSNVVAIAPTATISNIMGTTPCIEPNYKNLYVKSNLSGDFIVLNNYLVKDLKKLNIWDSQMISDLKYFDGELEYIDRIPENIKHKHRTVFAIQHDYVVKAAARRQKWIDQSQSVNLFLKEASMRTLSHMYRLAWSTGLKTTYYLRTLQASNIEKATQSVQKEVRGVMAQQESEAAVEPVITANSAQREFTQIEKNACSIESTMNGEECEACQ